MSGRAVVVGMGNDYRRDDGVGPVVARLVAARLEHGGHPGVDVIAGVPDPLDLLGRWDAADVVVVVDAVRSGAPGGTVSVIELSGTATTARPATAGPPGSRATSTHGIGIVTALRLARAIGQAPERVVMVAVEGDEFGRGEGLGPAVSAAVPEVVGRVLALVAAPGSASSSRDATRAR